MRCSSLKLLGALALPLSVTSLSLFDWIYPGSSVDVSSDVVAHKIAIIGAGAGGSSAAFWAAKARARSGVAVEVDVYEREGYVGGRSTTVFPYDDATLDPVELGASIFVESNKNLWRAAQEFNLTKIKFDDDDNESVGFWDGEKFVFIMNGGSGIFGWLDNIKALWRYGFRSPSKTKGLVKGMIGKFISLYSPSSPSWSNITELASELGWTNVVAQTAAEYFDSQGVSHLFSREVIESATRVNYGQDLDKIHALEGMASIAANGASSVKGGNFQIFQNFLARSGARLYLNTTVTSIVEKEGSWIIKTSSGETKTYNDVIIAAPFHSTGIKVASRSGLFAPEASPAVPPQPYVHLHVTLLTTTAQSPDPAYFALKSGSKVPVSVLTTYEGARLGGKVPEFNSLSYHGPIAPGREEHVVKIFSKEERSDEWLNTVFGGKVGWVLRKEWDAYPVLPPTTTFPPVVLAPGLYYVNAFEPFISTMETETISSRNVVNLLFQERFGTDICGKRTAFKQTEEAEPAADVEGEQIVLEDIKQEAQKPEPQPVKVEEDFVLGWDCL
ncbi:Prenylcysteine lyase-domain-containing protein [Phellopilus nigrolimitatus]|nr:Prenylcysteine lyase-domain-containing protein [Phellopilus nigrolimitatus]